MPSDTGVSRILRPCPEGIGYSDFDPDFHYAPGKLVRPRKPFNENIGEVCGSGIHFYLTEAEARAHTF